jgi:2'-5' RNA ligase
MNNLHRVFIAINLPEKIKNRLGLFQDRWPELPAKWTRVESLHIALNFLGGANDQEVCEICQNVIEIAKRHDPFDLVLDRIVYGPEGKIPPRMVWAMGEKSEELGRLQRDLENTLYEFAGADSTGGESIGFAPHVTLARLIQAGFRQMEVEEIPVVDEKINNVFLVESIEIMESELKRGGPKYTVLESVRLGEE